MDTYRGLGPLGSDVQDANPAYTAYDDGYAAEAASENDLSANDTLDTDMDDVGIDAPLAIGRDERRMQVRAYNFWTAQLGEGNYPNIEELDPEGVEDFRDYSVLLDFTSGIENPSIQYVGEKLRIECGVADDISYLDEVPPRSLLSRITDHYMQIIANRAPIGFEAEFINDRGVNLMYRGILLPYSSDDDTIDFIYGVINWKEAAAAELAASLQSEVEGALATMVTHREHVPVWADGPAGDTASNNGYTAADYAEAGYAAADYPEDALELGDFVQDIAAQDDAQLDADAGLADWLAAARSSVTIAADTDARSRDALYRAIGRAYDFSLAAARLPQDYAELLADAGIKAQERAPMTPVVKLIFGAGYDKTRLTEFAAVLDYAHRNVVAQGALAALLAGFDGGLKGLVQAERRARKVEKGTHVAPATTADPRPRLRNARARDLAEFAQGTEEFVVLVARRNADGGVDLVGSVADAGLTDKVLAKTLV
jgi:hypothetical protein